MSAINSHLACQTSSTASPLRAVLRWISHRFTRASQYAALEELDDHLLRDVSVTREDLRRARRRWFA